MPCLIKADVSQILMRPGSCDSSTGGDGHAVDVVVSMRELARLCLFAFSNVNFLPFLFQSQLLFYLKQHLKNISQAKNLIF